MKPDYSMIDTIKSLRFEGMSFGYSSERRIFENVTCEIPVDRIVMIEGERGGGQSTLLKLIGVLMQPHSGAFLVNGLNTTHMSFEEFLPIRRLISYTFDYGGLFANRTLRDNLTLGLLYHKSLSFDEANEQAQRMAEHFGFQRQIDERPAAVSGGLRKLTCVLRSFMMNPEMLVMDDPFMGLDTESATKVINIIHERREAGQMKHVFFTSRDEFWPKKLGYDSLVLESGAFKFREKSKLTGAA
ncbi:MAG TPA: ATP-binding cassette domain-containing protein [Bdellovibrionales bacterium]|nr:ATP-binding cassette domain-containing protein [Bdellovibrionales bacterium]